MFGVVLALVGFPNYDHTAWPIQGTGARNRHFTALMIPYERDIDAQSRESIREFDGSSTVRAVSDIEEYIQDLNVAVFELTHQEVSLCSAAAKLPGGSDCEGGMLEGKQTAALNSEDEEDVNETYLYGSCALKNTFLDWARTPANSTARAKSAPPRMTQPHYSKAPGHNFDV
eukprot:4547981-Karenia_brevis.AAC.1